MGVLQGQSRLVPFGCHYVHLLQWNLSQFWNQFLDPPSTKVSVLENTEGSQVVAGLGPSQRYPGDIHQLSHRLFTDACPMGWGAHLQGK